MQNDPKFNPDAAAIAVVMEFENGERKLSKRQYRKAVRAIADRLREAMKEGQKRWRIVTTGTGALKAGFKGCVIDIGSREVYLGESGHEKRCVVAEFTIQLDSGVVRQHCELTRDFEFERA